MAGRLSLGGFAAAGLMRVSPSPRVSVYRVASRKGGCLVSALGGNSNARRRFSDEWTTTTDGSSSSNSALYETFGDVDRVSTPLPAPSLEQKEVVASVRSRVNVVVEAVAGSGKTTTVLHCARDVPHLKFLVLTYNARLKLTTRQRARELRLQNVETHSFHAAAAKYYAPECRNDETLRTVVDGDWPPRLKITVDVLVIDEAQDLTPLLHKFVLKILRDAAVGDGEEGNDSSMPKQSQVAGCPSPTKTLLVLGDSRQSIYQFRDADPRFLTMADRGLYLAGKVSSRDDSSSRADEKETVPEIPVWRHHTLRTSFRATPRIASFVNDAMLGFECIKTTPRPPNLALPFGNRGAPVTYMVGNEFQLAQTEIADEIEFLLSDAKGGGYAPDDIFVLTPSLKGAKLNSKTPLAQLENTLVMRCGIPVYVSLADEEELSDSLTRGKICFTTFHSSKGLERPVVFVFGFSGNYFTYFARDAPRAVCPNTLYVAATRASEKLYVVGEAEEGGKLPFLRLDPERFDTFGVPLPDWLEVRRSGKLKPPSDSVPTLSSNFAVTELVKFLPEQTMRDAVSAVGAVTVEPPSVDASVDASVPSLAGKGLIESVSDITGLAVVAAHEHKHTNASEQNHESADSKHTTSLARRLQSSLQKMEKQLEANAAARANSEKGASTKVDLIVEDVEAIRQIREVLGTPPTHVRDFLKLASWYEAMEGGYLFRPFQLSHFDWVSREASLCVATVLEKHLPTENGPGERECPVPAARYEKRYDVSFRFGASIVTIRGAADVVTAGSTNGEIFEVKCVNRLLPEHLLQLALYQWLDAFGSIQGKINKARQRRRQREGGDGKEDDPKTRTHRGWKGGGKGKREYTEEESEDPVSVLEQFLGAGGDDAKIMKRAVLLNSRTGEAVELSADLRTLTGIVLSLVDRRVRTEVTVSDEVFLANCERAGAAIHEAATPAADGGFVPTPRAFADEAKNETFDVPGIDGVAKVVGLIGQKGVASEQVKEKTEVDSEQVTGQTDVAEVKEKTDVGSGATSTKTVSPAVSKKEKKKKAPVPVSALAVSTAAHDPACEEFVTVDGARRPCDMSRRVLTDGNLVRPRGRAPGGRPFWDARRGEFTQKDPEEQE